MYIIYIYLSSLSTSRTLFRNACAWLKEYWQVNDQKVEMEELWDEKKYCTHREWSYVLLWAIYGWILINENPARHAKASYDFRWTYASRKHAQ